MKVAILGFAGQGKSSYEYWKTPDNEITICDRNPDTEIPDGAKSQLGDDYLANLDRFDMLVRTPVLHPRDIVANNSEVPDILEKVTSNTNEFFRVCQTKNIIGITGTKGKGTTSTLVTKILESAGKRVHLGGNIGTPPLDLLKNNIQPDDWVVLELANFQLIDLKYSPKIAVCLMITGEHLDWHEDLQEYINAKKPLFGHQAKDDTAIYYSNNQLSEEIAEVSKGSLIPYYSAPGALITGDNVTIDEQVICQTEEIKLLGQHNWQNVCAAVTTTWQVTKDIEPLRQAITNFSGLEYRLEFIKDVNGVKYYNDSFGTTPETAMVAVDSFSEPKVIILGGSDKGADFSELAKKIVHSNVKQVITIGQMGPIIASKLRELGYNDITVGANNMPEIVGQASKLASSGDIVLLSTACASFGMFKNYKDRGDQFNEAVLGLA